MRLLWLLLLLAVSSTQVNGQQDEATATGADVADAPTLVADVQANIVENSTSMDDKQILAQVPPINPMRSGIPSIDAFYLMFPALSSLLRWGSMFPAHSILGALPDNLQSASSKVVLVLADDANSKAQKSRVARQDDAAALPATPSSNLMQTLSQSFSQMPPGVLSQMGQMIPPNVGQMLTPNLGPTLGQSLGQSLLPPTVGQALPGLDLSQISLLTQQFAPMLGAPPPAAAPPPPAETPTPKATVEETPAPVAAPNPFASFFNPPSFDGSNNLLGQALPQTDAFMSGLSNFFSARPSDSNAQASNINEVRVKPDAGSVSFRNPQDANAKLAELKIKSALQSEEQKQHVPLLWFRIPSNPDGQQPTQTDAGPRQQKNLEDLKIEAKLQDFERQVIAELKLLQQIERLANDMRASAQQQGGDGTHHQLNYPLSRTPVHKITRADIEHALRDEYVKRLLHSEMQRKTQSEQQKYAYPGDSVAFKRQIMSTEHNLSKEDIVKMMAYAYRMANEQIANEAEMKTKEDKIYAAYRANQDPMAGQMNPAIMQQRQWADEQAAKSQKLQQQPQQFQHTTQMMQQRMLQQEQTARAQQNPMLMMVQQRQWADAHEAAKAQQQQQNPQIMQQRQWADNQEAAKAQQQQQIQQMMQQRQWADAQEAAKAQQQQNPQIMQQRQWADAQEAAKAQQQQQIQQMMQQRQWADAQEAAKAQQQQQNPQIMQQRQWADAQEAVKAQQQQQIQQMMQQRQWADAQEAAKAQQQQNPQIMQQRQWADNQEAAKVQQQQQIQQMMKQRQWVETQQQQQQQKEQQQQQRQWADQQKTMEAQRQLAEQQQATPNAEQRWAEEKMRALQQQQSDAMMKQQPQSAEETMLGEAEPQMPENAGQARFKVDLLGLGGNKRKKQRGGNTPTIINYYHSAPAPVSYTRPSYGTSYGGGGYGSNAYGGGAYRALGNDEIDEMLRRDQTMRATHFRQ